MSKIGLYFAVSCITECKNKIELCSVITECFKSEWVGMGTTLSR